MQIWRLAAQNMPVTRLSRPVHVHGPESQVRTAPELRVAGGALRPERLRGRQTAPAGELM
jgi:hypothetical protein